MLNSIVAKQEMGMTLMNDLLKNMIEGLALHYLHRRSVEEAIKEGKEGGLPTELVESLPGMMFEITWAACAVHSGQRSFDDVVSEVTELSLASGNAEDFGREDAVSLVKLTIEFIEVLIGRVGAKGPLHDITKPWYLYGMEEGRTSSSSGPRVGRHRRKTPLTKTT